MNNKRIALTMIVRNEENVLNRCLDSVKDIVNEYSIVDTGSHDNTLNIIKQYTNRELYRPFDNFINSRNYALSCVENSDYSLVMDADEWLEGDLNEIHDLIDMDYDIIFSKICIINDNGHIIEEFWRPRLWKNNIGIRWDGPNVHEYLVIDKNHKQARLNNVICKNKHKENKNFEERDNNYLRLLEEYYANYPDDNRCMFYLARTYRGYNNRLQDAINIYEKFVLNKYRWVEELWQAYMDLAECYRRLDNIDKWKENILNAIDIDNRRAESYCYLADYYYTVGDYINAINYYNYASNLTFPEDVQLFSLREKYYEYPIAMIGNIYKKQSKFNKAKDVYGTLIDNGNILFYNKDEIMNNLEYCRFMSNKSEDFLTAFTISVPKNNFILQVPPFYDGLGDNLIFSHIPRIAKESGRYDKVYISTLSTYKGDGYRRIVWDYNPYVDGFVDEQSEFVKNIEFINILRSFYKINDNLNILDLMMLLHGLDDGLRNHSPEIYYKPKLLKNLKDISIIDVNAKTLNLYNEGGSFILDKLNDILNIKDINLYKKIKYNSNSNQMLGFEKIEEIDTNNDIEYYCDIIYSCKNFICVPSGSYFISDALNKKSIVLMPKDTPLSWMSAYRHNHITI